MFYILRFYRVRTNDLSELNNSTLRINLRIFQIFVSSEAVEEEISALSASLSSVSTSIFTTPSSTTTFSTTQLDKKSINPSSTITTASPSAKNITEKLVTTTTTISFLNNYASTPSPMTKNMNARVTETEISEKMTSRSKLAKIITISSLLGALILIMGLFLLRRRRPQSRSIDVSVNPYEPLIGGSTYF